MTSFLATGDIHLTDDPRDEYRWRVFTFLRNAALRYHVEEVVILGDLTEKKDNHSSKLVNRIVDELRGLPMRVWLMKGNHDYDADPTCPFFRFIDHGGGGKIRYFMAPTVERIGSDLPVVFIPHVRKTAGYEWPEIPEGTRFVFCHQTFSGAVAENGSKLHGIPTDFITLPEGCEIVSGDIHVPQRLLGITYAGAPHPIRFGDVFKPRVLYFDGTALKSLARNTIRKESLTVSSVEDLDGYGLREGDQIKVTLKLRRRDFPEWPVMRESVIRWARESGIVLLGPRVEERVSKDAAARDVREDARAHVQTPLELFRAFCADRNIDPVYVKAGEAWIHDERRGQAQT